MPADQDAWPHCAMVIDSFWAVGEKTLGLLVLSKETKRLTSGILETIRKARVFSLIQILAKDAHGEGRGCRVDHSF